MLPSCLAGDTTIRCEQLDLLQDWLADFRKSTSSSSTANPEELVAFDVICGDLNFDNCSSGETRSFLLPPNQQSGAPFLFTMVTPVYPAKFKFHSSRTLSCGHCFWADVKPCDCYSSDAVELLQLL